MGPDLLRAAAILLVMLVHLPTVATPALLGDIRPFGWIGVDLFFVLSGYLIGGQLLLPFTRGQKPDLRAFYIRRSLRILPAFLVVLLFLAMVPMLRDAPSMPPLLRFLTFTMNFDLDARQTGAFTEAWSLCVEEQFYLVLPLLLLLHGRVGYKTVLAIAAGILVGGMSLRFAVWQSSVASHLRDADPHDLFVAYLRDIYYPSYLRLDGLMFGLLLALTKTLRPALWQKYSDPRAAFAAGFAVLAIAIWLLNQRGELAPLNLPIVVQSLFGSVFGFPLLSLGFALLLVAVSALEPALARWPIPGMRTTARLSYGLYLTHKSVMHVDQLLLSKDLLQGVTGFVIYMTSCYLVAALLWLGVERPFLRLRERLAPASDLR